jgi:hypothetical protein
MKKLILLTLSVPLLLVGCARTYTITFNNGHQIYAASKPKLEGGNYVYKDAKGQPVYVPAGRVREIAPSAMASSRHNSGFNAAPMK